MERSREDSISKDIKEIQVTSGNEKEKVKHSLISANMNKFLHSVVAISSLSPGPHVPCKYEF